LNNGSDALSGVDSTSGIVERDSAVLSANACGSFSGTWTPVTLVGGADTTVTSGHCYKYRYKISDNVGNQATSSASTNAKVDATAPSAPSLTLSESSALEYATGTTLYYDPQGSNSASFSVSATTSDSESSIPSVAFPTVYGSDSST